MTAHRLALIAVASLLACPILSFAQQRERSALLIGNSAYARMARLPSAANDVRLLGRTLETLGFRTSIVQNAGLDRLDQAVQEFAKGIHTGDAALLYYAGYGLQFSGENYLLGVEFDPGKEQEIDYAAYSFRRAISEVESRGAWLNLLLVDGAYDEPSLRHRYPQPGMAPMTPGRQGTLIGFAAAANQAAVPLTARSPEGVVGLYARALVETLSQPSLDLSTVFNEVKRKVNLSSGGRQVPVETSTVVAEFLFNPKSEEDLAWDRAVAAGDRAAMQDFARRFPGSPRAAEIRKSTAAAAKLDKSAEIRKLAETAIQLYKDAFEGRDIAALKAVWPTLSRQELDSFQNFFRIARTIRLTMEPQGEPSITGDAVTWVCIREVEASDERNRLPAQRNRVTVRMKRGPAGMTIDSITVVKE